MVSVAIHCLVTAVETHKIGYMTMLFKLASRKVKQLFPGRRRRFCSFRQMGEREITSH
jgi:hypothetical protein